jgi:hypothetical protein
VNERDQLMQASIEESLRSLRMMLGKAPERPEQSIAELRAELALRRAENDLAAAEWHAKRRRGDLRVI